MHGALLAFHASQYKHTKFLKKFTTNDQEHGRVHVHVRRCRCGRLCAHVCETPQLPQRVCQWLGNSAGAGRGSPAWHKLEMEQWSGVAPQ